MTINEKLENSNKKFLKIKFSFSFKIAAFSYLVALRMFGYGFDRGFDRISVEVVGSSKEMLKPVSLESRNVDHSVF